jgi:hypothetical protein
MSISYPSSIRLLLYIQSTSSRTPECFRFYPWKAPLPNDNVLPTADAFTECFEENLLPNGILLPNSAHMSVSSLYQFLVLTLSKWQNHKNLTIKQMAIAMSEKFEKYWGCSSTSLAVACFFDPKYKKKIIEFYTKKFVGDYYQVLVEEFVTTV